MKHPTFDGKTIHIANNEFVEGQDILITGDLPKGLTEPLEFEHAPIAGSISLEAASSQCTKDTVLIENDELVVSCDLFEDESIRFKYQYVKEHQTSFTLDGDFDPETATWTVQVNGVVTESFQRQGKTIILPDDTAIGQSVWIEAKFQK